MNTSPLAALRPFLGDPASGQVVLILASPGLGKTALLVHVALDAMCAGRAVLHVDVAHPVAHVGSRYRGIADALGLSDAELRRCERHRMVHSVLGHPFEVDPLAAHLNLLRDHAGFEPAVVVVDGMDAGLVADVLPALRELASQRSVPLWVTLTHEGPVPAELGEVRAVRLTASGREIQLSVHDGADHAVPVTLEPGTLVVARDGEGDEVQADQVVLYSGGAQGSEALFGEVAAKHGVTEVNYSFPGHKQARTVGRRELTQRELAAGDVSMVFVSRRLNRTYHTEGTLMRGILQTIWHQVSQARQVFVVGAIQDDGTVVGGTGWSVELARMWNKDLWVYCQDRHGWFHWQVREWVPGEPRITAQAICGTGTRKLEADGRAAIEQLFERSFG